MSILTNLISYWKLDEASGDAIDAHGSNNLTDTNTVASTTGKIGNARDFENGNLEYFTKADNASLSVADEDFTITGWVKFESAPGVGEGRALWSKWDGAGNQRCHFTEWRNFSSENRIIFWVSSNGTATANTTANALGAPSTGVWYFIVVWHDSVANTINIQINDGTVNSTSHSAGVFDSTAPFQLGQVSSLFYHDGLLDEVGFWKRVLTSGERTSLYNSGNGLAYPLGVTFTASVSLTGGSSTLSSSNTFAPGTKTATASLLGSSSTLSASSTFSPGTKTASVSLSGNPTTLADSPIFEPGKKTVSGDLLGSSSTLIGTVSFVKPIYSASVALNALGSVLSASTTFVRPTYTTGGTLISQATLLASSVVHTRPTFGATVSLVGSSSVLSAALQFSSSVTGSRLLNLRRRVMAL